jgi:predicted transporter
MDLNIMLWIGGMIFSLGIFALKVGLGLGYGRVGAKGIALTLGCYTALFMVIAVAAGRLMRLLEPLLTKGAYMHNLLAAGMIIWGVVVIIRGARHAEHPAGECREGLGGARLLLIIPCPVCLTAMTFSIWAALNAVKLPPLLTGLCLGSTFALMALLVALLARARSGASSETSLGMAMIVVGLYFVASLFLPAKIEAAKGMYASFITENRTATGNDGTGVLIFMLLLVLAGFIAGKSSNTHRA